MKRVWMILSILGYYATIIAAGIIYDFKASVLVIIASCLTSIATAYIYKDEDEEEPEHEECED